MNLKTMGWMILSGRPMKIQLVGDTTAPVSALQRTGTAKVFAAKKSPRGGRGGFGAGRGRGRGGRGGRGAKTVPPSKEDLDAQLDAYNARMETE
ncbi:hypothetical protein LSH36_201g07037 [Paralvinella palmiformis]|uniref:Chromatin target of PRMT1 protein C-terminal domain-containing protein n=1 Tax=Paralvinella palmiformis TaxID=53620 RepID=A0AAD9JPU0_9ANNE|nr:hypothetical protein LSH36_201g07037 [Paralvinella palmiformis]